MNNQKNDNSENTDFISMKDYKFSADELRVIDECNTESFYKRSLPISTGLGIMTYHAVKKGYLKPNTRYGAIPKTVGAIVFGYIAGKLSYREECVKKLMNLPDSKIANVLRARKNMLYDSPGSLLYRDSSSSDNLPAFESVDGNDRSKPTSSLDIDVDRPSFSTMDESLYRSTVDSFSPNNDITAFKPSLSYDELRKQNREENHSRFKPYKSGENSPMARKSSPEVDPKNKYGDTMN